MKHGNGRSAFHVGAPQVQSGPGASPRTPAQALCAALTRRMIAAAGDPPLKIRLWNGAALTTGTGPPLAELHFRDRAAWLRMLRDPQHGFARAYTAGELDVRGDLPGVISRVFAAEASARAPGSGLAFRPRRRRVAVHTRDESRANVHHHYDLGADFYSLWLDPSLSYTCAYYATEDTTLADAQLAKMHLVAKKLWLRPGETVIEAGCGWGSLALLLAREYGVHVRAFNVSHEQIRYARAAAAREGLLGRVEFVEDDWRAIRGRCDAFVSVGMLEHVGVNHYGELGRLLHEVVAPHGRGLIHSIGRNDARPVDDWIRERVFPGSEVPSLAEMATIFAPWDLSVLDVENLRLHYALTLRDWLAAYDAAADRVRATFDDEFMRTWRLYLAGSCAAFRCGEMQLFQVVFAPRANSALPLTRGRLH